jgi:hypothetical protein
MKNDNRAAPHAAILIFCFEPNILQETKTRDTYIKHTNVLYITLNIPKLCHLVKSLGSFCAEKSSDINSLKE